MSRPRKKRQTYTAEFKAEAIRLIVEEKRPISELVEELEVSETALRNWLHAHQQAQPPAAEPLSRDERAEFERMRQELRRAKMDNEILKKAVAFFAKETR